MERLTFAAVADDDTGASDLAGMLAEQGVGTVLILDLPTTERLLEWSRGADAVIMAEGTRAVEPRTAYERTRAALRLLAPLSPRVYQLKYCSTFDSTEKGNIGPSIDAAMDELGEAFTVALPALPVNGRTTYMGYHFVHQQLLSDSPMRDHPLTPMRNPNLVDFLGRQTRRRVGLVAYPAVEAGAEAIRRRLEELCDEGIQIAILDCLNERHLCSICEAVSEMRLISGSSAPGMGLPAVWRARGWLAAHGECFAIEPGEPTGHGCLVVAGSCSVATRAQNEWLSARGVKLVRLDPRELAGGTADMAAIVGEVAGELCRGRHCLMATSAAPEEVRAVQHWGRERGLSVEALGLAVVRALAEVTRAVVEEVVPGGLIFAGGETSGALCRKLELGALRVGRNIEPGVPQCASLGRWRLPVVLKSGNFGSRDFYGRALGAIGRRL